MTTAPRRALAITLALISACSGGEATGAGGSGGRGTQTFDRSSISFVDNLLVKVEAGEWTLGEGLVATLKLLAGELDASVVLRHSELLDYEGTGIVAMAYEYLEDGPDAEAKTEIGRLLNLLVLSNERLEAMAGLRSASLSAPLAPSTIQPKDSFEDCREFFHDEVPPGIEDCLEHETSSSLDVLYPGEYRIFHPAASFPVAGWTEEQYDLALEALEEIVPVFKERGELPPVNVVFSVKDNGPAWAQAVPRTGEPCGVAIFTSIQQRYVGDFKQVIAHELAHCFQTETFPEQDKVKYEFTMWREEGLANYLSNLVYRDNNLEWGEYPERRALLDILELYELASTLLERSYTNSLFFQYLENRMGTSGIFDLIRALPTSGSTTLQEAALAAYPGMDEIYHDFAKAMADGEVFDTSGSVVPYKISEQNRPTIELAQPHRYLEDVKPFGVSRYRLVSGAGQQATLAFTEEGYVRESARPSSGTDWAEVPSKLPGDDCNPEVTMVVTAVDPNSSFQLEVLEVEDTEGSCGLVGTWVVDNSSLDISPMAFMLDYIRGKVEITFRGNGTAEVVYSNFEYRIFDDDTLIILGEPVMEHEEFIYTTNAHGVTSYEVDGDEIAFGDVFESDYLEGTQEIHHIRTSGGALGEDIDEILPRDPEGLYLFGGYVNFDIQSDGSVLQLRFGDRVQARLKRKPPSTK